MDKCKDIEWKVKKVIESASKGLCIYTYYYHLPSEKNFLRGEINIFLNQNQSPENIMKDFMNLL